MTASLESSDSQALEILRTWDWTETTQNPSGGVELHEAVNRLAMNGLPKSESVILSLLCSGELIANGDYRWQKFAAGSRYQHEDVCADIAQNRWQELSNLIDQEKLDENPYAWFLRSIDLERLGMEDCKTYDWDFVQSRFSTALKSEGKPTSDPDYFEQWFSAGDLSIRPASIGATSELATSNYEAAPKIPAANSGGRPPIADWEAAALEMAGRYYRGDLKPNTIADVGRELAAWLAGQDIHPSDSVLRAHGKTIFDALRTWEQE